MTKDEVKCETNNYNLAIVLINFMLRIYINLSVILKCIKV